MSQQYRLDTQELKKVLNNALIFSAPAIIIILTELQNGKSWEDIQKVVYLWLLNTLIDLFRKFKSSNM